MTGKYLSQSERALLGPRPLVLAGGTGADQCWFQVPVIKQLAFSRRPLGQKTARVIVEGLPEQVKTGRCRFARIVKDDLAFVIKLCGVIERTIVRMALINFNHLNGCGSTGACKVPASALAATP